MQDIRDLFTKDTANHQLQVLREDGVYRHLRFSNNGSSVYHFDLITWPGSLCYTGDMGTFVFFRVHDMLEFFRAKRRADGTSSIDHRYWAEKCDAGCSRGSGGGIHEFDPNAFKREITVQRRRLLVEHAEYMDADMRRDFWESMGDLKTAADDGEHFAWSKVLEWSFEINKPSRWGYGNAHIGLDASDFPSCKRYTMVFLWCCQALAWGVEQYDQHKAAQAQAA